MLKTPKTIFLLECVFNVSSFEEKSALMACWRGWRQSDCSDYWTLGLGRDHAAAHVVHVPSDSDAEPVGVAAPHWGHPSSFFSWRKVAHQQTRSQLKFELGVRVAVSSPQLCGEKMRSENSQVTATTVTTASQWASCFFYYYYLPCICSYILILHSLNLLFGFWKECNFQRKKTG